VAACIYKVLASEVLVHTTVIIAHIVGGSTLKLTTPASSVLFVMLLRVVFIAHSCCCCCKYVHNGQFWLLETACNDCLMVKIELIVDKHFFSIKSSCFVFCLFLSELVFFFKYITVYFNRMTKSHILDKKIILMKFDMNFNKNSFA
jgi:hypothetical protein